MNKLLKTYNFFNFKITKVNGSYLYTSKNQKLLDRAEDMNFKGFKKESRQ